MKTRTTTRTEYAPMGLTSQGIWRPIGSGRYNTPQAASVALEENKTLMEKLHRSRPSALPKAYKIMKRTVTVTFTEWEDVTEINI